MAEMIDDEAFMRHAAQLSRAAMESGRGGPFGAVIVRDGKVIAEGANGGHILP